MTVGLGGARVSPRRRAHARLRGGADVQGSDPDKQSSDPAHARLLGALPLQRYHRLRYGERNANIHALAFRSGIDLIGASQKCAGSRQGGRMGCNTTHAGDNNTDVRCMARTDVKNRVVLLNPLACAPTYYIFLNARQKQLMVCLGSDDTVDEGHGATQTPYDLRASRH